MRRLFLTLSLCLLIPWSGIMAAEDGASEVVRFQGLKTVTTKEAEDWIQPQIEMIEAQGVSMARADDAAFFLESAIRDGGYQEATVEWVLPRGIDSTYIILEIDEGPERLLGEITIMGNANLEDEAVLELLTSETAKRVGKTDPAVLPWVPGEIRTGVSKVEEFYWLMGYSTAKATLAEPDLSEPGVVNLRLEIEEGQVYRTANIRFPELPFEALEETAEEAREEFAGKTWSEAVSNNLGSRLESHARDEGFYNADVEVFTIGMRETDEHVAVDLQVSADWGERFTLSGITVQGNEKVDMDFFNRHFRDLVGETWSPIEAGKAVQELLRTGAFDSVRTEVTSNVETGTIVLDVLVDEGNSRRVGIYGGAGNYEGSIIGLEYRNVNLFGTLRSLNARVERSGRGLRGEIEYYDPWFRWSEYDFTGAIYSQVREEEGFETLKRGVRYEWSRSFGEKEKHRLSLFGEARRTEIEDSEIDPIFLGDLEYFAHSMGLSYTLDARDNKEYPRSGLIAQTSVSVASDAIGSEVEYVQGTGRLGYYLPVGKSHVLRMNARAGIIQPMGDTEDIPIDQRFFNGGATTVRSFQERALGPSDSRGFPTGGEFYTIFNVEYEIPIPQVEGLSFVPFADAGNLLTDASDAGLDDLRYAVGAGLRYRTPIGPLRVEYGYNPDQREGEPQGTFHIGFGFAF